MITRTITIIAAAVLIGLNYAIVIAGAAPAIGIIIIDALISAGIVVALCLVDIRPMYRGIIILLLIIGLLFAVRQSDLFVTTDTTGQLEAVVETGTASGERPASQAVGGGAPRAASGASGAWVHIVGKRTQDGEWADRLTAGLNRRIGGLAASAIRIEGYAATAVVSDATTVTVTWGVAFKADDAACGQSTTMGWDDALLIEQIEQQFEAAIARTLATGVASCP